jgi:hypothetical protein
MKVFTAYCKVLNQQLHRETEKHAKMSVRIANPHIYSRNLCFVNPQHNFVIINPLKPSGSISIANFEILKLYILPTLFTCGIYMVLTTNSHSFPKQH